MGPTEKSVVFLGLYLLFIHAISVKGDDDPSLRAYLTVDTSFRQQIPENLVGIFFEEINHAGAGGLWSELVGNRGFEAGGSAVPSNIEPWGVVGDETTVRVATERSSCFDRNKIALKMESFCGIGSDSSCPLGGVGIFNTGFWGMNIVEGKRYKLVIHVSSTDSINLTVAFTDSASSEILATKEIIMGAVNWTKVEFELEAKGSSVNARLQLTTSKTGVVWLDQISAMPVDTFNGHGFRSDLIQMLLDVKPRFMRFPGGCYVEGGYLRNAFRWKDTVGPWEERPGHFGDLWNYWTDDGLGFYELLLLAEDIGAKPIWVFNNGISHNDVVDPSVIEPFVQEAIDGIEFAVGESNSTWGSVRTAMGHPEPFDLQYVTVGNEDCTRPNYQGNYMKFYGYIRKAFPSMKIISNCDFTQKALDHPADYFEFHSYPSSARAMFSDAHHFDGVSRKGPKGFASEYAVHESDAGAGTLFAAIAEAAFLLGVERNSDLVEMASYAPLFQHVNYQNWKPNCIIFNSTHAYGTPSYWMQHFFIESCGAVLHNCTVEGGLKDLEASAMTWRDSRSSRDYLRIKVVNFSGKTVNVSVSIEGKGLNVGSGTTTVLTSDDKMDENSLDNPKKIVPTRSPLSSAGMKMEVELKPYSLTSIDLLIDSVAIRLPKLRSASRSSSM